MTVKRVDLSIEQSIGETQNVGFELDFGDLKGDKGDTGAPGATVDLTGVENWKGVRVIDIGTPTLEQFDQVIQGYTNNGDLNSIKSPLVISASISVLTTRTRYTGDSTAGSSSSVMMPCHARFMPLGDGKFIVEKVSPIDAVISSGVPALIHTSIQYVDISDASVPVSVSIQESNSVLDIQQGYTPRVNYYDGDPNNDAGEAFEGDVVLDVKNKKIWIYQNGVWADSGIVSGQGPRITHQSGNISLNYADNPASDTATGNIGSGCYMKALAYLSSASDEFGIVQLNEIPCKSDGTPIPYNLTQDSVKMVNGNRVLPFTVAFGEVPLYKMNRISHKVTPLLRGSNNGGITSIPVAADGQEASELTYYTSVISI